MAAEHDRARVRAGLLSFLALALVALAAGASRMWPPAFLLRHCGDVLRWREALSMLVFAPALVLLLWQLYRVAADGETGAWALTFIAGAYFLGAGMGMHDTCNLLGDVYVSGPAPIRASLSFFDDRLGHWVFFAGFVLTSVAAGVQQVRHPLAGAMTRGQAGLYFLVCVPLLFVMLTNLMFEKTGVDLGVIAAAILAIAVCHLRRGGSLFRLPILCILYPAYGGAVAGTLFYWAVH